MDTLALLCNLHADGPATLQRLRRVGCESLAALLRLPPADLGRQLDWNERRAERFQREADLLAQRLDEGPPASSELEPEDLDVDPILGEEGAFDEAEAESEEDEGEEDGTEDEVQPGFAPPSERVEAVLGAWRELDRVSPPPEPAPFVIPRPEPLQDLRLAQTSLPGLNAAVAARLAEHGIVTLRGLVAARDVDLARTLQLGFTRVKHLQFLAARELATLPAADPAPEASARESRRESERRFEAEPEPPGARFEPYSPPPAEPFETGPCETAGPFA